MPADSRYPDFPSEGDYSSTPEPEQAGAPQDIFVNIRRSHVPTATERALILRHSRTYRPPPAFLSRDNQAPRQNIPLRALTQPRDACPQMARFRRVVRPADSIGCVRMTYFLCTEEEVAAHLQNCDDICSLEGQQEGEDDKEDASEDGIDRRQHDPDAMAAVAAAAWAPNRTQMDEEDPAAGLLRLREAPFTAAPTRTANLGVSIFEAGAEAAIALLAMDNTALARPANLYHEHFPGGRRTCEIRRDASGSTSSSGASGRLTPSFDHV
ncbi:hypothetical protein OC835_002351 [Tilletia horrida]|nr:hypothetical protein OC835_002351 [Tilletia horrida]